MVYKRCVNEGYPCGSGMVKSKMDVKVMVNVLLTGGVPG